MPDEEDKGAAPPDPIRLLRQLDKRLSLLDQRMSVAADRQRATARAVADLTLGLNAAKTAALARHDELTGLLLGFRAEVLNPQGERRRLSSEDRTDSFKLPTGDRVELTRRTQRRILRGVLLAVAWIGSLILQHIATHALERTEHAAPRLPPASAPGP